MRKHLFCQNLLDDALGNSLHQKLKTCLVRFLHEFLMQLKEVVPAHLSVTIVTNAGFHRQVLALGWNVIGRIYTRYYYQFTGENIWRKAKDIVFRTSICFRSGEIG